MADSIPPNQLQAAILANNSFEIGVFAELAYFGNLEGMQAVLDVWVEKLEGDATELIEMEDKFNDTAFTYTCETGFLEGAEFLVELGADVFQVRELLYG